MAGLAELDRCSVVGCWFVLDYWSVGDRGWVLGSGLELVEHGRSQLRRSLSGVQLRDSEFLAAVRSSLGWFWVASLVCERVTLAEQS